MTQRTHFAWWPVRIWETYRDEWDTTYARRMFRWGWFRPVVQMSTLRGWIAYRQHQSGKDLSKP